MSKSAVAQASRSRALAAFALAACAGCQESARPPTDGMATHRVRHMEETHWLVDMPIGGEPDDTTLLIPGMMAFQNGHLLVFDYGDGRLKVFDPDGTWLWSFGRFGDRSRRVPQSHPTSGLEPMVCSGCLTRTLGAS